MHRIKLIFLTLAALLMTSTALAVTTLESSDLQSACKAYAEDVKSSSRFHCVLYMQGFLDGEVATDERVTMNIADDLDRSETLTERAIFTRSGDQVRVRGPTFYAEYGVGEPVPVKEVIGHVLEQLSEPVVTTSVLARDVVYASLRRHYLCEG